MNPSDATLTRLLAAEARGELSEDEGRELQAMLEERLRQVDPQPPPPWDRAWSFLQARIRRQRRVTALAATGVAVSSAALVTFTVHGSPSPWVVLGGLGVATLGLGVAAARAWRRAAAAERIAHDDGTALFVAMRTELEREILALRRGGVALLVLLSLALGGLTAAVGPSGLMRSSGIAVVTTGLVVAGLVGRELWVTLPRLIEQRRRLG